MSENCPHMTKGRCDVCVRLAKLEERFRDLRGRWFDKHIRVRHVQRTWEPACVEDEREALNQKLMRLYDVQTERIISGRDAPLAPMCINDVRRAR